MNDGNVLYLHRCSDVNKNEIVRFPVNGWNWIQSICVREPRSGKTKAFYVLFYFLNISINLQVNVPNFEYQ